MGYINWLKREISRWEEEQIISADTGRAIWQRYQKERQTSRGELFFIVATVCILAGIGFLCAGFWSGLTQDEQFWLAISPLVLSLLFVLAVVAVDKKIPILRKDVREASEVVKIPGVPDLPVPDENTACISAVGKKKEGRFFVPGAELTDVRHLVPVSVRELAGFLHGVMLLGALWMVRVSFTLGTDWYGMAALGTIFLFLLMFLTGTVSLGLFFLVASVITFYGSPYETWPQVIAWVSLLGAIPFVFFLLREGRQKGTILFSWSWAVALLLLTFWSTESLFWQTLFFSLAASVTWLMGEVFRKYGIVPQAFRIFGGIAVFAILLEASFGSVWAEATGNWLLWGIFILVLLPNLGLILRVAGREQWLSVFAGLTPFILLLAAVISVFQPDGALSSAVVSVYSALLALGLVIRGYGSEEAVMKWAGIAMIVGVGLLRIFDSVWTLGQRGLFFLAVGGGAAMIYLLLRAPQWASQKPKRKKRVSRPRRLLEEEGKTEEVHHD